MPKLVEVTYPFENREETCLWLMWLVKLSHEENLGKKEEGNFSRKQAPHILTPISLPIYYT